jgi:hypothetical protein
MMDGFPNLFDWIQGLEAASLPPAPFRARKGVIVRNPGKWLKCLQSDAALKRMSPRHKTGALQSDLREFYFILQARKDGADE